MAPYIANKEEVIKAILVAGRNALEGVSDAVTKVAAKPSGNGGSDISPDKERPSEGDDKAAALSTPQMAPVAAASAVEEEPLDDHAKGGAAEAKDEGQEVTGAEAKERDEMLCNSTTHNQDYKAFQRAIKARKLKHYPELARHYADDPDDAFALFCKAGRDMKKIELEMKRRQIKRRTAKGLWGYRKYGGKEGVLDSSSSFSLVTRKYFFLVAVDGPALHDL